LKPFTGRGFKNFRVLQVERFVNEIFPN